MATNLEKIQQLSKIYRDVLVSSIEGATSEEEKVAIFKEVKMHLGGYISERAIIDLNFLINNKKVNIFNFDFIKDERCLAIIKYNHLESLRCLIGLNRDGNNYFDFIRYTLIIIENILLYYYKVKFNGVAPFTINSIIIQIENGYSYPFYCKPIKEKNSNGVIGYEAPDLHNLLLLFIRIKMEPNLRTNFIIKKGSENHDYLELLIKLKNVRNIMSHEGVVFQEKGLSHKDYYYLSKEIKQYNYNFVLDYLYDIQGFVKRELN